MIYLDSAATSLQKPPEVARAVVRAMQSCASPGRGDHAAAMRAAETVFACREEAAVLFHMTQPENVVFTMNATHALNIAVHSLVQSGMRVAVSGFEHNAVMRPLYASGASILTSDTPLFDSAALIDWFERHLPECDAAVCTCVSNVFGFILPVREIAALCRRFAVPLIVDASQSAGILDLDFPRLGAAFAAMPGHKGLLGPQGTGGLYVRPGLSIQPLVVGGSGVHSFDEQHPAQMPTALEAGTLNVPGLAGLCAGVEWILAQGVETLCAKETALAALFYKNIRDLPNVKIYGDPEMALHAPIISLNIGDEDSARIADILWEDYSICVRAGAHCAPLMHKALGTVEQGVVRFSFSHFNTEAEVLQTAAAVQELAQEI